MRRTIREDINRIKKSIGKYLILEGLNPTPKPQNEYSKCIAFKIISVKNRKRRKKQNYTYRAYEIRGAKFFIEEDDYVITIKNEDFSASSLERFNLDQYYTLLTEKQYKILPKHPSF